MVSEGSCVLSGNSRNFQLKKYYCSLKCFFNQQMEKAFLAYCPHKGRWQAGSGPQAEVCQPPILKWTWA